MSDNLSWFKQNKKISLALGAIAVSAMAIGLYSVRRRKKKQAGAAGLKIGAL